MRIHRKTFQTGNGIVRSRFEDADKIIPPYQWIELMQKELQARFMQKVIGEAREGRNVGLFRGTGGSSLPVWFGRFLQGSVRKNYLGSPQKHVKFGSWNCWAPMSSGNIAPDEVIPLKPSASVAQWYLFHFSVLKEARTGKSGRLHSTRINWEDLQLYFLLYAEGAMHGHSRCSTRCRRNSCVHYRHLWRVASPQRNLTSRR